MKILLVQPPFNPDKVGIDSFYITEPLALEVVGASVSNHEVKLFDMRVESNLEKELGNLNRTWWQQQA